jgi:hypothetical protein
MNVRSERRSPQLRSYMLGAAALLGACVHVHVSRDRPPQAGAGLAPGDRVVSRWKDGFYPATVLTVQHRLVTIAWDTPPPERGYAARDAVSKQGALAERAESGAWLLCYREGSWSACRVERVEGARLQVVVARDGTTHDMGREEVCEIPPAHRAWAVRHAEQALATHRLQQEIAPSAPASAGKPVSEGEKVAARWPADGFWYDAVVVESSDSAKQSVTVRWYDDSTATLAPSDVAPTASSPQPGKPGELAFCRWRQSPRWWRARVERIESDGQLAVIYRDGTTATLSPASCLAAQP